MPTKMNEKKASFTLSFYFKFFFSLAFWMGCTSETNHSVLSWAHVKFILCDAKALHEVVAAKVKANKARKFCNHKKETKKKNREKIAAHETMGKRIFSPWARTKDDERIEINMVSNSICDKLWSQKNMRRKNNAVALWRRNVGILVVETENRKYFHWIEVFGSIAQSEVPRNAN